MKSFLKLKKPVQLSFQQKNFIYTKPQNSLYDRLGGENTLSKAVNIFYDKIVSDSNLNIYFRGSNQEKLREHQKRFLSVAFGGPSGYTGKDIKQSHQKLGISVDDFEIFKNHLEMTFLQMGISKQDIEESLKIIEKSKDKIVGESLFHVLGGQTGIDNFLEKFQQEVLNEESLKKAFNGNMNLLNDIVMYTSGRPHSDLDRKKFKLLDLDDRHFFLIKKVYANSLRNADVALDLIDRTIFNLESQRNSILNYNSTYNQLGGQQGIKTITSSFFTKVLKDPILKPYFRETDMENFLPQFESFFAYILGGSNQYRGKNIKVTHGHLNLNDTHLDAFKQNLAETLRKSGINEEVVRDALWQLERHRRDITSITLYEMIGGEPSVNKASDILYRKIIKDPELKLFFQNRSKEESNYILRSKLIYALGGPSSFRTRDLKVAHKEFYINKEFYEKMEIYIQQSLKEIGVVESLIIQIVQNMKARKVEEDIVSQETIKEKEKSHII